MSTVQIIKFVAGEYRTNIYLVFNSISKKAFIVDPGYVVPEIYEQIDKLSLIPEYIILTHGHKDHTGGIDDIKKHYPDIKLCVSKNEKSFLQNRNYSKGNGNSIADIWLSDGDEIYAADTFLEIIETPGHTPGGICILMDNILFSGDTLFKYSIGRTDMPGGNEEKLLSSIKNKLFVLQDDITVLPGHSESTTIAAEKRFNPFV